MEYVAKYVKKYRPAETWQGPINVRKKTDHLTEAQVTGRGSSFTILLGDYVNGNFICILEINEAVRFPIGTTFFGTWSVCPS